MADVDESELRDSCKLWMGDLSPCMDETLIRSAFRAHSFELVSVSWVKNQIYEEAVRRCYLEFPSADHAKRALESLNQQPIPGSSDTAPTVRPQLTAGYPFKSKKFQLNWASKVKDKGGEEHSLYVGNLSAEVDSLELLEFFQSNYPSVISAKVVNNDSGTSQGFGFIKFLDIDERDRSIAELDGLTFVGTKPVTMQIAETPQSQSSGPDAVQRQAPPVYAYGGYVYGTKTKEVDKNCHEGTNYQSGALSTAPYSYTADYSTGQSSADEMLDDARQVVHSPTTNAVSSSVVACNSKATSSGHTQVSLTSLEVTDAELIAHDKRLFEAMQEAKWDLQFHRKILGASPLDGLHKQ